MLLPANWLLGRAQELAQGLIPSKPPTVDPFLGSQETLITRIWLGGAKWSHGCLGFSTTDVVKAITDDFNPQTSFTCSSTPLPPKNHRVKWLDVWVVRSQSVSGMKTSKERALKNTCAHPKGKWSWDCSIWRVILCYSAANYFLDFAGETLLVREHVVQNSSLAEKPEIKIFASSLGDVGSLMNPNQLC